MNGLLAIAVIVPVLIGFAPPGPGDEPAVDLAEIPLPELFQRLGKSGSGWYSREGKLRKDHFEALLQEIVKRGGATAEKLLSEELRIRRTERDVAEALHSADLPRLQGNLELLTALRRVQKKPDPLQVEVKLALDAEEFPLLFFDMESLQEAVEKGVKSPKPAEEELKKASAALAEAKQLLEAIDEASSPADWAAQSEAVQQLQESVSRRSWELQSLREVEALVPHARRIDPRGPLKVRKGNLPFLVVSLRSADVERVPVWRREGGDGPSGYPNRWRFEVRDSAGKVLRSRDPFIFFGGGGISIEDVLPHGATRHTELSMSRYIEIEEPGDYTVTILYHNEVPIAELDSSALDDLIISRSQPFKLTVSE